MALADVQDAVGSPVLPFIGETDLSVGLIVALFIGLMLMALIKPASENAADWVAAQLGNLTGFNPQTGQTGGNQAPVGGA